MKNKKLSMDGNEINQRIKIMGEINAIADFYSFVLTEDEIHYLCNVAARIGGPAECIQAIEKMIHSQDETQILMEKLHRTVNK